MVTGAKVSPFLRKPSPGGQVHGGAVAVVPAGCAHVGGLAAPLALTCRRRTGALAQARRCDGPVDRRPGSLAYETRPRDRNVFVVDAELRDRERAQRLAHGR